MKIFSFFFFLISFFHIYAVVPDPNNSKYDWMNELIEKDFKFFSGGINLKSIEETQKARDRIARLRVINNKIYVVNPAWTGNKTIVGMLTYLTKNYGLPDLDILYLDDDGLHHPLAGGGPVFVSSKRKSVSQGLHFIDWFTVLPEPDWDELANRINNILKEINWSKRKNALVWRGNPTDSDGLGLSHSEWMKAPRGRICNLSLEYPDLIDAYFVNGFNDDNPIPATCMGKSMTIKEQMSYKYQIILDGYLTTYPGDRWRLLSGSVSFKPDSIYSHWFYDALVPWVHYVPVKNDLSDLVENIHYLQDHDDVAIKIAKNARDFALNYLMSEDMAIYCYKALLKYASLQNFNPHN